MLKISIKAARVNAEMSRKYVASAVGVSYGTIKNWECGITYPTQPQIEKLCDLFNIPYDAINFLPKKLTLS